MNPTISVVIPTHDRRSSVLRLLRALGDGGIAPERFEVLVVADGCSDNTVEAARAESVGFSLQVLEQAPARGSAAARNLGAAHARGELLVFLDDDIEPFPGMLAAHERAHRALAAPAAVLGPSHPVRRPDADWRSIATWDWWDDQFAQMRRPGHRFRYDHLFSGNMSIPADFFAEVGGFEAEILCRHDYELGLRVIRAGGRVAFEPAAAGWHHESRDHAAFQDRKLEEGAGDVALLRRHPALWPALSISHPLPRGSTIKGLLRRLAFMAPWLGDIFATGLGAALSFFEYFRMRGAWGRARARLTYYGYWRGVASSLGGRRVFLDLRGTGRAAAAATHPVEIELDLREGLAAAEQRLDQARPDGVWMRFGTLPIGRIAPQIGAEPLCGAHLRLALATDLALPLIAALGTSAAAGDPKAWNPLSTSLGIPDNVSHRLVSSAPLEPGPNRTSGEESPAVDLAEGVEAVLVPQQPSTIDSHERRPSPFLPDRSPGPAGSTARVATCTRARKALPLRIVDLEIGGGIPAVDNDSGYGGAHVLLRRRGRPLAWVTVFGDGPRFEPEQILAAWHADERALAALDYEAVAPREEGVIQPPISVVVCTRDRQEQLARCLRSLASMSYPSFEVVVVDNAPTSDATRLVASSAGVRYASEPAPGLDRARNRGLAEASYDILAYTDDDVEVDRGWLAGLAHGFADPHVEAVTGMVAPAALETEAEILFELCYGGMGKGTTPRRWDPRTLTSSRRLETHHAGVGANMAFRRRMLEQLGGFDTALDVGTPSHGGGDLDMFHRVLHAGGVIQYEPSALVRHHHRRDMAALERQHRDSARAYGVYLLKVLRRGSVSRAATMRYVVRRWWPWLIRRVVRSSIGRESLPGRLVRAELVGALQAPWAYLATYSEDRRMRGTR